MTAWPYPGDSPIARVRRCALAYRALAEELEPQRVAELDARLIGMGEAWVAPAPETLVYHPEQWLTPAQAAELLAISVGGLAVLRRRGRVAGRNTQGRWHYQAKEIYELMRRRTRGRSATDTIDADATSVPAGVRS